MDIFVFFGLLMYSCYYLQKIIFWSLAADSSVGIHPRCLNDSWLSSTQSHLVCNRRRIWCTETDHLCAVRNKIEQSYHGSCDQSVLGFRRSYEWQCCSSVGEYVSFIFFLNKPYLYLTIRRNRVSFYQNIIYLEFITGHRSHPFFVLVIHSKCLLKNWSMIGEWGILQLCLLVFRVLKTTTCSVFKNTSASVLKNSH